LARTLADAVVLGDSHGDVNQAARVLAGTVRRHSAEASTAQRVEALGYLAELAVRRDDVTALGVIVAEIEALSLTEQERGEASSALASLADLRFRPRPADLPPPSSAPGMVDGDRARP
jgi:hypothetical protein